jgi:hypothetical protein
LDEEQYTPDLHQIMEERMPITIIKINERVKTVLGCRSCEKAIHKETGNW